MYIVIRKYTKVRSVADAARRARSGIGRILRESNGFRSYYVADGGKGVGAAVMIFEDPESAAAANAKVMQFVKASLHDLDLGDPEIIAGEVLVNIESDACGTATFSDRRGNAPPSAPSACLEKLIGTEPDDAK